MRSGLEFETRQSSELGGPFLGRALDAFARRVGAGQLNLAPHWSSSCALALPRSSSPV